MSVLGSAFHQGLEGIACSFALLHVSFCSSRCVAPLLSILRLRMVSREDDPVRLSPAPKGSERKTKAHSEEHVGLIVNRMLR